MRQSDIAQRDTKKAAAQDEAYQKGMRMLHHRAPVDIVVMYLRQQYKYLERQFK